MAKGKGRRTVKRCLVTGASGFIGTCLIKHLSKKGVHIRALMRARHPMVADCANVEIVYGDIRDLQSMRLATAGISCVFHLAGHAHAWAEKDDGGVHENITVEGTSNILRAAGEAGVEKFIFFSSVKAGGEGGERELDESAPDVPITAYGVAKREAEELVRECGRQYGMHVCSLRLSMVYGEGMKGNLLRMVQAIDRGWFPRLPGTCNRRSMVSVDDVIQAALLATERSQANGKTYIVTDGQTYSTQRVYELICNALGRQVPRWSVPMLLLKSAALLGDTIADVRGKRVMFDSDALEKLTGSAWYSSKKIQSELGYEPSKGLEQAVQDIVHSYRRSSESRKS